MPQQLRHVIHLVLTGAASGIEIVNEHRCGIEVPKRFVDEPCQMPGPCLIPMGKYRQRYRPADVQIVMIGCVRVLISIGGKPQTISIQLWKDVPAA